MSDVNTLVKVIQQIELILSDHIELGYASYPEATIERIITVMNKYDAVSAADRIEAGHRLRVVK